MEQPTRNPIEKPIKLLHQPSLSRSRDLVHYQVFEVNQNTGYEKSNEIDDMSYNRDGYEPLIVMEPVSNTDQMTKIIPLETYMLEIQIKI